jgi:3-oxoacyl-[acyl-carrier protein] reductase
VIAVLSSYTDLAGRVAVVTGGSRGIGAQTARMLAAQGVRVCVVGRDADALDGVVGEITASGGVAVAAIADLTSAAAVGEAGMRARERLGPVEVLCAFAGGQGRPAPSEELTEARWREILDADLTSAFLTIREFLPDMADRGRGSIIAMSSAAGRAPSRSNLAYGVANAGLIMLVRHLATEFGPRGIRVNALAPSSIRTEKVMANMPEDMQYQVAQQHPLRRLGTTTDVAEAALFLASDASSYLTGLTIDVAGGRITN